MSSSYGSDSLHGPQQNPSIFDFPQGHYPTTRAIDQFIASSADNIAQSNPVGGRAAFQNQADIFQPFFDLRSIPASSSSTPDRVQVFDTDSTLQSFSTTSERAYPQLQRSQPVFTTPQQPLTQPQAIQHAQSSRPNHPPRSLLPRPGRPRQQESIRQSSSQSRQTSSQTRFAVQRQQPHATASQSNLSTSHPSSGVQQSVPWANEQQYAAPPSSASPSTGSFYHVSAVVSHTTKGPATGSQQTAVSTTQRGSSRNSEKPRGKRKRSRREGTQESSTVSDVDSDDDELAGGISVGMSGVGVVGKGEPTGRL
jgi:hypothetical protein